MIDGSGERTWPRWRHVATDQL